MSGRPNSMLRLDPKLRVICDGDDEVNSARAEVSGVVQTSKSLMNKYCALRKQIPQATVTEALVASDDLAEADDEVVRVSVFIETIDDGPHDLGLKKITASSGRLMTAEVSRDQLEVVAGQSGVAYVSPGAALSMPRPIKVHRHAEKPQPRLGNQELGTSGDGDVLIGLIDVGGFDFAHPDFIRDNATRFVRIWDQGAEGTAPKQLGYDYGNELTAERMNKALDFGRRRHVGATDLLPQSSQQPGAHGTHVASIAAGNAGVCPRAKIAGVLLALSEDERDRRRSLYDSTRLAHAVDYLFKLGRELNDIPVVINISLGTNGDAHDGSSPVSRWIDAALTLPGRCVCVAAGNAGKEAPQFEGDLGDLSGRIHTSGRIAATGLESDIEWQVVGNGVSDGSENELEIWYEPQDRFDVLVRPPSGGWIGPVGPATYIRNRELPSGTFLSVFNERYHPSNGANRIAVFLSPRLKQPFVGVEAGTWTIRLRGRDVRDGRFHGWIERDDPRPLGRIGDRTVWRFPSYFSRRSNVDNVSVNSLACGHRIVSVANYDERAEQVNRSSSQGPTRDGRFKPEIAAPGTDIVAARGFSFAKRQWMALTGTSMASPYVAGVTGLMLALERRLTASQIVGIMRRTAQPLPGTDYLWQDGAGFGSIRAERCLEEAATAFEQKDLDEEEAP